MREFWGFCCAQDDILTVIDQGLRLRCGTNVLVSFHAHYLSSQILFKSGCDPKVSSACAVALP